MCGVTVPHPHVSLLQRTVPLTWLFKFHVSWGGESGSKVWVGADPASFMAEMSLASMGAPY